MPSPLVHLLLMLIPSRPAAYTDTFRLRPGPLSLASCPQLLTWPQPGASPGPPPPLLARLCLSCMHTCVHKDTTQEYYILHTKPFFWGRITPWSCEHELPWVRRRRTTFSFICMCFLLWLIEDFLKYFVLREFWGGIHKKIVFCVAEGRLNYISGSKGKL